MLWVPHGGRFLVQSNVPANPAATAGTSVTTGAAASTYGTRVELIASTNFDVYMLWIGAYNYSLAVADAKAMLRLWTGAATEELIIDGLIVGNSSLDFINVGRGAFFPLYIPTGTRISCDVAGQRVTTAMSVVIHLWGGNGIPPFQVGRKVITYGISTVPLGTTIVPGVAPTAGAWTAIAATTSEDHFAIMPGFDAGDDTTKGNNNFFVDVGIGAATEEEIVNTYIFRSTSAEEMYGPHPFFPAFHNIPSGSRLVARAQGSAALDAGNYNACLYAVS